ncbi:vacuolar protein sorting-associated protein 11 [Plasmodium gonderi]|uniref:Vacuolar protein sorting-associated protein 11 n=1 Tax=Plasmodium gonderi TaxID=77519 RepID=A0A1Y1JJF3_PLAGO|nr:vacuolar protein sorting-associated protein 11 [Plasmodium gonderi]GAW81545.1 vacuolar protein sorting-associated protein 11 [Plasmodium gonderi]
MFSFRKLPLFEKDQTKDTDEVKNFLNSHEGIYFSNGKKFINVFVDKVLFIDPINLNVTTINSDLLLVDFCFCEKTNNLVVLGKSKNTLVCSIYNIRAHNFILLKKIQLSKKIENIKKTLISKCLRYIITLENNKILFYCINNDYTITKNELLEEEEKNVYENMFLCKEDIFIVMKKSSINVYRLFIKDSIISFTFIECITLDNGTQKSTYHENSSASSTGRNSDNENATDKTSSSNNDKAIPPFHEPVLSIYNEEINILYICHNVLKVLYVLDLNNKSLECILLENKVINLFTVKFYLILLTEVSRKFYVNIYVIYEEMKLQVFRGTFNYLITNIVYFNNLLFLIIDEYINQPEVKVDKFYFYEQLKMKWNTIGDIDNAKNSKSDSISNLFKDTENNKSKNFDILKMYNDSINNNNSNLMKGDLKYDIFLDRKDYGRNDENNNLEDKQHTYSEKLFKLNKVFKNCRNQIKTVIKEKNMNEIIHVFKKKKLFLWLLKYSNLNQNYHSVNFCYVHSIYADFLFEKEQYELAMHHYINTIGYLETANVIYKYLNLELYQYLSAYLEKLHEINLFNDEHTMMLLSCYKKECKKKKIISFIKNNKNKINLQKIYKFLSNVGYYNVVLKISKKNKDHLTYISILIDKFENYEKSLKYIFKLDVENICILLFRYGYKFIKYFPQLTIYLLKKIIKKYNLNLTIFIPLFLDNIDFLFLFILKFLDKKKEIIEGNNYTVANNDTINESPKYTREQHAREQMNNEQTNYNYTLNESTQDIDKVERVNIVSNKKIEFDIFNGEYDYILFVTVMQILLQKFKKKEKNNHTLIFNIDKLIKNEDKNITFLSAILLSIYNYNKGLLYISNKMNKYDMSFLFKTQKMIKKFRMSCVKQISLATLEQKALAELQNSNNYSLQTQNLFHITNKKFEENLFNVCMHLLKIKNSLYHNYIFYYLSLLNDEKYLTRFIKILNKKSSISLLHLISILQKYNKNYGCIKKIVISYMNQLDQNINKKYAQILRDKRELYKIKKQKLKQKYNFHIIDNTYCSICKEVLSAPIIHFLCNHSYHFYCLNGNEDCILCRNKDNEKKLLKEKAQNAVNNFDEFFKYLQGSPDKFSYISNYLSYGVNPTI